MKAALVQILYFVGKSLFLGLLCVSCTVLVTLDVVKLICLQQPIVCKLVAVSNSILWLI